MPSVNDNVGIVLFRLTSSEPDADNQRILDVLGNLGNRTDWAGHFSVVTDDRVRMRPLPEAKAKEESKNEDG